MKTNYQSGAEGMWEAANDAAGKSVACGGGASLLVLAVALALGAGLAGLLFLGYAAREVDAQAAGGKVLAWGYNDRGQTNVLENAWSGVTAVDGGSVHSLALKEDGSVVAWGSAGSVQTNVPQDAKSGVKAIAAGDGHNLALKTDGSVIAWGLNLSGETETPEAARTDVKAIAGGSDHSLALKNDGSVVVWGSNDLGQKDVPEDARSGIKAIDAGAYHNLAVNNDGRVVAWGYNFARQIDVPDAAKSGVKAVAGGRHHSLALKEDGSVVAWGSNASGQSTVPEAAGSEVKAIAAGDTHSLALKNDGSVITWGSEASGKYNAPPGAKVGVTAIGAGRSHSLAIKTDTTPPAVVESFAAKADPAGKRLDLSWTNPTDIDFTSVRVLRSTTGYATSPEPGAQQTQVYEGAAGSFTDTGLADDTRYYYTAFAYDGKNFSSGTQVEGTPYDATPPDTTLGNGGPSDVVTTTSATFEFTSTEEGSTFECSLDGAAFETCDSGKTYENLDDGPHAFEVRAIDAAGNEDSDPAQRAWVVDTGPPDTSISSGPSGTANSATATFGLSSTERGSTFECSLDGASFAACDPEKTYGSLSDGFHVFEARAVDAAGTTDPTPVRRTWSVDTVAPNTGITDGPYGTANSATAAFEFLATESGATFECSLDGADFTDCESPEELNGLSDGPHTFRVRATDAAGHVDPTPAGRTWSVDANTPGAPVVSSVSPTGGATRATSVNVTVIFSEAMDPETITASTIKLVRSGTTAAVPAKVNYDPRTRKATLDPSSKLKAGAKYKATVTTEVKDLAGNPLSDAKSWRFTVKR